MEWLGQAIQFVTDVRGLIQLGGLLMVCVIVFVETGLFFGFFLPGDSLLVTAGVFAAAGDLNLAALLGAASVCAVIGDQVGYWIGRKAGRALYSRPDSTFFKRRHLERAHAFYEKYGGKTIVLARFVPIIRTFAPPVAGAAEMTYRKFVLFNVAGGVLWVWSMVWLGFLLGRSVPNLDRHIHLVIGIVVFLSVLPGIVEFYRARRRARTLVTRPTDGSLDA
ncbi:MAG TPA: VTT domain-containing protein [Gemmatimonadales bacterium]|nr:VTT domain-containing protein [Gemmatimonadales bacterium]